MRTTLAILLTLLIHAADAQDSFTIRQERIFAASTSQWLCKELTRREPAHFNCDHRTNSFQLPDDLIILDQVNLNSEFSFSSDCDQLYFPGKNCLRFLQLKALHDLYGPLLQRKLSLMQLPSSIQYLPLVLTGFNAHFDNEQDRSGMWAMDYIVARRQGLRVDSIVDERRGADFTADKMLKYISELYANNQQDFNKVLIALYRSNAYVKQITDNPYAGTFEESLDYDSQQFLYFFYYSVWLFENNAVDNQLAHYFELLGDYQPVFFTSDVALGAVEEIVQPDMNVLKAINPVYTGAKIEGNYRKVSYLFPKWKMDLIEGHEQKLYDWKPPVPIERDEEILHIVKRGETLGSIAKKYHVSVAQLKKWNKIKKDRINQGQRLVIIKKVKVHEPETDLPEISDEPIVEVVPTDSIISTPPPIEEKVVKPSPPSSNKLRYKVKSGDSLWSIAKKYKGVTPEKIMKWNNCGEKIRPGQILIIYPNGK